MKVSVSTDAHHCPLGVTNEFVEVIDQVHPLHRRSAIYAASNRYNNVLGELSIEDVYSEILGANDIPELCAVVNYAENGHYDNNSESRNYKVNFTSLMTYGTIEFRQHVGTTDPRTMLNWVKLLLKCVNFAKDSTLGEIMGLGQTREVMVSVLRRVP